MIVRAAKHIQKDQEISIAYRSPELDYAETQKQLNSWGFTCTCRACVTEAQASKSDRKQRQALIKELEGFLETHESPSSCASDKAALTKAKKLYDKLNATYDRDVFANIPRFPLIRLGSLLCAVYSLEKMPQQALETVQTVLRDCAYTVDVKGRDLGIDDTYCYTNGADVDAAICAAQACFAMRWVSSTEHLQRREI